MNHLFQLTGFAIVRVKKINPVNFRGKKIDPREISCSVNIQPILVDAPIDLGRGLPIFSFSPDGSHPYVRAVLLALKKPHKESAECIFKVLSKYYELVQPVNAASVLNLNDKDVLEFDLRPSWSAIMPWEKRNLDEWSSAHWSSVLAENHLYKRNLTRNDGWAWVGPVSIKKLKVEVQRLDRIFHSILENNYNRNDGSDGDILAEMLVNDSGEWCWQAISGQHRVSVLSGMGFNKVPIRIVKIIFRRDVEFWSQVRSKLYSKEVALKVFDNIFSGNTPEVAKNWEEHMRKGIL